MKKKYRIVFTTKWVYLCCLLFLCSPMGLSAKKRNNKKATSKNRKTIEQQIGIERTFIEAINAKILEDYQLAYKKLMAILAIDPQNDAVLFELAKICLVGGDIDCAVSRAKKAVEVNPSNKWYSLFYAEILIQNKRYDEAINLYKTFIKKQPNEHNYHLYLAYLYTLSEDYAKAIDVYNDVEKLIGITKDVSEQKKKLYLEMNNLEGAVKEIKKLSESLPNDMRVYHSLADIYVANNKREKAIEVYRRILDRDPDNFRALISLALYYKEENQAYRSTLYKAFEHKNPSSDIEMKTNLLARMYLSAFDSLSFEEKEEAVYLSKLLIKQYPNNSKVYALYGDISFFNKKYTQAAENYQKSLEQESNVFSVWNQLIHTYLEQKSYKKMYHTIQSALELYPNKGVLYYLNAQALINQKDTSGAIQNYLKCIRLVKSGTQKQLATHSYADLGVIYHLKGEYKLSDMYFEKSLEMDSRNHTALNNYSYYLSERDTLLDKALEMIQTAVTLSPNVSAYEDTYAWILYKQGDYAQALVWQEKAMAHNTEKVSATLYDHYGNILFKLGRIKEAVLAWEKAKQKDPSIPFINQKIVNQRLME